MRSTFMGLETAKRSLFTQQAALTTVSHNIANSNTEGYSRQTVNMAATEPMEALGLSKSTAAGQIGTGVEASSVTRMREAFLDDQYRNENENYGNWSIQQDTLEKLETIMSEPSDTGIRTVIDNFYSAWSDLSKDPESSDARYVLREKALALTDAFNTISKQLNNLKNDLTSNIETKATEVNTYLSAIADLNGQIATIEGLGDYANDLRDRRDLAVDKLSKIINVSVTETSSGYTVQMGNTTLVSGTTATTTTSATFTGAYGGDLTGGEMYGLITSRDDYVADYQSYMDNIANTIANGDITITLPEGTVLPEGATLTVNGASKTYTGTERTLTEDTTVTVKGINGLHKLGYLTSSTGTATSAGEFFTGTTAGTIQLSETIQNDPTKIASSMRITSTDSSATVVKGNNTLALLMSELKNTNFSFQSGSITTSATVDDYYRSIVGQLGVQSEEATRQTDNANTLVEQVDSNRQAVSGVSLDEEMTNMIKYQHAYNASARLMTTIDEMLDKIINSMGVVGR